MNNAGERQISEELHNRIAASLIGSLNSLARERGLCRVELSFTHLSSGVTDLVAHIGHEAAAIVMETVTKELKEKAAQDRAERENVIHMRGRA